MLLRQHDFVEYVAGDCTQRGAGSTGTVNGSSAYDGRIRSSSRKTSANLQVDTSIYLPSCTSLRFSIAWSVNLLEPVLGLSYGPLLGPRLQLRPSSTPGKEKTARRESSQEVCMFVDQLVAVTQTALRLYTLRYVNPPNLTQQHVDHLMLEIRHSLISNLRGFFVAVVFVAVPDYVVAAAGIAFEVCYHLR